MPVLPRGRLDQTLSPGLMLAALLGGVDHRHADAVLHRGQRVEEFELGQDLGLDARAWPPDALSRTSGVAPMVSVMSS